MILLLAGNICGQDEATESKQSEIAQQQCDVNCDKAQHRKQQPLQYLKIVLPHYHF